jgi:hypothetical protein
MPRRPRIMEKRATLYLLCQYPEMGFGVQWSGKPVLVFVIAPVPPPSSPLPADRLLVETLGR